MIAYIKALSTIPLYIIQITGRSGKVSWSFFFFFFSANNDENSSDSGSSEENSSDSSTPQTKVKKKKQAETKQVSINPL